MSDKADLRHKYLFNRIKDFLSVGDSAVSDKLSLEMDSSWSESSDGFRMIHGLLQGTGANYLLFTYQPEGDNERDITDVLKVVDPSKEKNLVIKKKCVFCARPATGKAIANKDTTQCVQDLFMGTLDADVIKSFDHLLTDVYAPVLHKMNRWGKNTDAERQNFLNNVQRYSDQLTELRESNEESVELNKVDDNFYRQLHSGAGKNRSADPKSVQQLQQIMDSWIQVIDRVVKDAPVYGGPINENQGPSTELEIWKRRLAKLNLLEEQLKNVEASRAVNALREARANVARWTEADGHLNDALAEAKENVKYLSSLEKFLDVVNNGTPREIKNLLPALINNIKMMYTIARYYSTIPRMTTLFAKIQNQMIMTCKITINPSGSRMKIWEQAQDPDSLRKLIDDLKSVIELNKAYHEEYEKTKKALADKNLRDKSFAFNEREELKFFGSFDLFTKRVDKLSKVFVTVQQFMLLKSYNLDQMDGLISRFDDHLGTLKSRTTDVLDIHDNNKFDTEFKLFDGHIADLETSLQVTINSSFENITSTENALNLLKKFQTILQTEAFKSDLDSKYLVIFHNYGLELENDQKLYEKHKGNPPMVRNITPVAGAITWARQLLRHIKGPMDKFASNESVMSNKKESQKIVRTFNKVSIAVIEYEAIWVDAWRRSIDSAKAGLNATLLVRDDKGRLFVNFDLEILQLIKETRAIMRMGDIPVPPAARMVLMQEQKLKTFYNELTFLVKQYERVAGKGVDDKMTKIIPMTRSIMGPNLDALDAAIRPGETTLTWMSMNIDGFLSKVHQAVGKLDAVVTKVNDIVTNRIQANLKMVSYTLLVNLQDDHFSLEQFVSVQEKHIKEQSAIMDIKNKEVQMAVEDVINTVLANQDQSKSEQMKDKILTLKVQFNRLMFRSILQTTTRSLNLIKKRVGTRNRVAFMFVDKPFFDVNVQLVNTEPYVMLHPSLDEVQKAINQSATAVLSCSKFMTPWSDMGDAAPSFFEEIARNKEIVKVVLLLTGGIHGLKKQVLEYLNHFKKFEHLWKLDKDEEYQKFFATQPTLEDFEAALSKFVQLEKEVEETTPTYNIGSLSLNTEPLKEELRKKAQEWKEMYARNLHAQASRKLEGIIQRMDEDDRQLSQQMPDQEKLEDLRVMMETLRSIRIRESEIDFIFEPVQEMYTLLQRYQVQISKEELDRVGDLRYKWKKLRSTAEKRTDEINGLQHGFKKGLTQEVQKFSTDVIVFRNDFEANGPMVENIKPAEAMERLKRYQRQFDDKERKWKTYMAGEELFGLPQHQYPELVRTKKELELLDKLYTLYMNVLQRVNGYNDILWVELDFDKIVEEVNVFQAQCKKLPKSLRDWEAYIDLKKILDDFSNLQPLIKDLKHPAIQQRHWDEIMSITKHKWRTDDDVFRLQSLVDAQLPQFAEEVQEIAQSSVREADIARRYKELVDQWKEAELSFSDFKVRGPIILKGDDTYTIKEGLEEASLAVNSMLSSRYCEFMRDQIRELLNQLVAVSETLGLWIEVQATWMYLEAVFAGGDIMKQLPHEAKRFNTIDKAWTKIMNKANEQKNVLEFCYENELLSNLPGLKDQLDECQRKLSAYLESKRDQFPRFYFVSDTVLLEILSQASDPQSIQPHLCSIFDGVQSVRFERVKPREAGAVPYMTIVEMFSPENEALMMNEPMPCVGNVEDWLNRLCNAMCATVREVVKNVTTEVPVVQSNLAHLDTLIDKMPSQIVLLVIQLLWTADVVECILGRVRNKAIVGETTKKIQAVKNHLVTMTVNPKMEEKPKRARTNVETLITIQVHQEEVWLQTLRTVTSITSFDWLRQARFYYKPEKDLCIISIADSDTEYCNEYLGVKERLVITQLTDRCYITLSQALAMYMGGAPAGPAGTGKTETTKDLARTFGKFCVVFNCSDQLDRHAMGKIIRGLSQANAWGCFDEFNRIELPVLSVVAQQVACVLQALKQHKTEFLFIDGQSTLLKPGVGFFITMNPGYAGRQELPENLKILFRGVTMMVPDRQAIMKVKLASQGYVTNDPLAKKFFNLYKLCEEQLSKQRHYDFGLRNILSVLRTAGSVLRSSTIKDEEFLFMRTLRDMNLSKLVFDDIELFDALIKDMFPNKSADKMLHPEIEDELDRIVGNKGLQHWDEWRLKIIQLYETKLVRHGIMVVGPALCGKTQCYDCMTETLSKTLGIQHVQTRMNPKAITAPQMFGRKDPLTGDWHDGIFASLWRRAVKNSKTKITWIVCDGPVDAIWIENLNTVLDDNKLLTLANGDRIMMTDNMKMCFEVENLANASPATVSRAGIIYISDIILGWRPVIESRLRAKASGDGLLRPATVLKACNSQLAERLLSYFLPKQGAKEESCLTYKVADYYRKECGVIMQTSVCHQVMNAFYLCVALGDEIAQNDAVITDELVQQVYWFSIAWAFGGMLETAGREKLDAFIRQLFKGVPQGEGLTIFDHKLNVKTGQWEHWNKFVEKWKYPGDDKLDFSNLFIPTLDSVRSQYLLQCSFVQRTPVLFMGVSGTAKTVTKEKFLLKIKGMDKFQDLNYKKVCFSSMTTPNQFYNSLDDMVEKMGPNYGPKGGGQLALFIDDINMPEINEWGDQITNEIVRQVVEGNEYCSLDKGAAGDRKKLRNLLYLGAMSHPGGGKNDIPNRLKRHFFVLNMPLPDTVSIQQIFGTIFESRFGSQYNPQVVSIAQQLTKMSIHFWRSIQKKMLPTPSKFHYFFNLRDLSNICQGIMLVGMYSDPDKPEKRRESKPWEVLKDATTLVQAWRHECNRVFSDKLNTDKDKAWYDNAIQECVTQFLGKDMADATKEPVYFVNYLRDPIIDQETGEQVESAPKIYEPAQFDTLAERLYAAMQAHNETPIGRVKKLDLVLFDAAIKHVGRIIRALAMPRGNILMVGVGGSGKQSLTRLASFVTGYDYATITLTKGFGVNQLFDAIREQYINAALGRPVSMVFTDNEIKQEVFLEFLNSFLSTGEIAGLFAADQRDGAINEIRAVAKKDPMVKATYEETPDWLWKYFIGRVRDRLHMVLCFSPVGEKFRTRARKFPALISSCIINWFFPWPDKALLSVSERTLKQFKMETDDKTKEGLRDLMANIHTMMLERSEEYLTRFRRSVFSTPKSYLSFIAAYTTVYQKKYDAVNEEAKKINNGLKKLQQAAEDVRVMRTQLQEKEVLLMHKKKETDVLVKEIEVRTAEAEIKRKDVEQVKNRVAADAAKVQEGQQEAKRDLAVAEPALLQAVDALNSIQPSDFQTLKKLTSPPALIKRIFDGVAILLMSPLAVPGAEIVKGKLWITDSWEVSGKSLASDSKTLGALFEFGEKKKDLINEETCELLLPYLWMEDFNRDRAAAACGNVAGLCTWVRAMHVYINIAKIVAPKKERLRIMENDLKAANKKKQIQEDELAKVSAEVAKFNQQFQEENAKKVALEEDALNCKKRMDSANGLIEALSGERERWTQQSNEFKDLIRRLVGDVALSCAFISYCGPFNSEFRHSLLYNYFYNRCKQLKIPVTENINIVRFLVDETTVADWQLEGLPADDHSVQNAIMITTSSKWPLMIDPQGQALSWIRRRTAKDNRVTQMNDKRFFMYLQEQLGNGRPFILEDTPQELDPMLDPILEKQISKSGRSQSIKVNDQDLAYHADFTFFMTTKLPNPSFTPELFAKCLIIDFTVTQAGLEQQLLSQVISQEKSELNEESAKLSAEINGNEKRRKNLEDRLLKQLAESKGNLIDDYTLIETLQETKDASADIKEKLSIAMETRKRIAGACEEYRPVATRGSVLYFLIVELSNVNPMYQTSLPQFLALFEQSILRSEKVQSTQKRIQNIIEYQTFSVFQYIVRGLFTKHKLLFVLLIACKVQLKARQLDPLAFDAFLKGHALYQGDKPKPTGISWLKDKPWASICVIAEAAPKVFKQLPEMISRQDKVWGEWVNKEAPENEPVPEINEKLEPFERMLLVRALREDRTMLAAAKYISAALDKRYAEPQQLDLGACIEETSGITPIIFLLSQGSDPTNMIEVAAKKAKRKVVPISMGQGQEDAARKIVEDSWNNGDWGLLQNCHLGLPFLVQLEEMMRPIVQGGEDARTVHEESRIWITAEPHPSFPIGLLQMSIKLTNEPPQGIRAGIIRSYSWLSQDSLDAFRRPEWKPLLFTQCFLHSIVQERRKFGPIGFAVPYEFNQGDWTASVQFLQNHLTLIGEDVKKGSVNWDTIRYMVAEIQYGGRITDNKDRELFNTITKHLYDPRILTTPKGEPFSYTENGPKYGIPTFEEIPKHREFIQDTYPDVDQPEAFAMHSNADITYRTRQAVEVLATILDIQPRGAGGGGGLTREERVLQTTDGFLKTLPDKWNPDKKDKLADKSPLSIFASQEIDRLMVTIKVIRTTCNDLRLAVAGTIIMSPHLQDALNFISDARVPPNWTAVSWPSPSISLWFPEVMRRWEQLDGWARLGRPMHYWLAGFFNPQGFLTSVRQEITRSKQGAWALDRVETRTEVRQQDFKMSDKDERSDNNPNDRSVLIYGLFLDGCSWNRNSRRLQNALQGELYKELPILHVYAGLAGEKRDANEGAVKKGEKRATSSYRCPVYKYPNRTDLHWIFDVDLPCDESDAYWRMRGVALLGSID